MKRYDPPLRHPWPVRLLLVALSLFVAAPVLAIIDLITGEGTIEMSRWRFPPELSISYLSAVFFLFLLGIAATGVLMHVRGSLFTLGAGFLLCYIPIWLNPEYTFDSSIPDLLTYSALAGICWFFEWRHSWCVLEDRRARSHEPRGC